MNCPVKPSITTVLCLLQHLVVYIYEYFFDMSIQINSNKTNALYLQ